MHTLKSHESYRLHEGARRTPEDFVDQWRAGQLGYDLAAKLESTRASKNTFDRYFEICVSKRYWKEACHVYLAAVKIYTTGSPSAPDFLEGCDNGWFLSYIVRKRSEHLFAVIEDCGKSLAFYASLLKVLSSSSSRIPEEVFDEYMANVDLPWIFRLLASGYHYSAYEILCWIYYSKIISNLVKVSLDRSFLKRVFEYIAITVAILMMLGLHQYAKELVNRFNPQSNGIRLDGLQAMISSVCCNSDWVKRIDAQYKEFKKNLNISTEESFTSKGDTEMEKKNLTEETRRMIKRYYIRPQNVFCATKDDILRELADSKDSDCSVYSLKRLENHNDVHKLTNRDIIYYYDDNVLYDKNHVQVLDYNLYVKNEEDRIKKDVSDMSDSQFKQEYDDRVTADDENTVIRESIEDNVCCICGETLDGYGNNAEPYARGRCCDACNFRFVIPARLKAMNKDVDVSESLAESSECSWDEKEPSDDAILDLSQDDDLDESVAKIEKHETLNPALWDVKTETLLPEVKEKIIQIANEFIDELSQDDIKFDLKDIRLVGSNCAYNYTKKSDLDVHLIASKSSLHCPDDLYPKLYSAYRSIFNKNLDISIHGVPVEIYVEIEDDELDDANDEIQEGYRQDLWDRLVRCINKDLKDGYVNGIGIEVKYDGGSAKSIENVLDELEKECSWYNEDRYERALASRGLTGRIASHSGSTSKDRLWSSLLMDVKDKLIDAEEI